MLVEYCRKRGLGEANDVESATAVVHGHVASAARVVLVGEELVHELG